jgi:hypothetical protein
VARVEELSDRRRSPRVRSLRLVTLEPIGAEAKEVPIDVGRTLDVSGTGVRVETTRELAPGQDLELQIAAGDRLVSARGRTVHAEPAGGLWVIGIAWVEIAPGDLAFLLQSA